MTHRLHADAVTLRHDARIISQGLSLSIPDGSFTVIVGPNACGKSTLLAALSRLLAPAEGRVVLDGKDIRQLPALSLIHISEPTRQAEISYAVFCLKKKR